MKKPGRVDQTPAGEGVPFKTRQDPDQALGAVPDNGAGDDSVFETEGGRHRPDPSPRSRARRTSRTRTSARVTRERFMLPPLGCLLPIDRYQ